MSDSSEDHLKDYVEFDYSDYWKQGRHVDIIKEQESRIVRTMLPVSEGWFADFGSGAGRLVPECSDGKRIHVLVDYALGAVRQGVSSYPGEHYGGSQRMSRNYLFGTAYSRVRLPCASSKIPMTRFPS